MNQIVDKNVVGLGLKLSSKVVAWHTQGTGLDLPHCRIKYRGEEGRKDYQFKFLKTFLNFFQRNKIVR